MSGVILSFMGCGRYVVVVFLEYFAFSLFSTDVSLKMDFDVIREVLNECYHCSLNSDVGDREPRSLAARL